MKNAIDPRKEQRFQPANWSWSSSLIKTKTPDSAIKWTLITLFKGRKDFIKRSDQANPQQEPEPANEEPVEENIYEEPKETNIYESIDPETKPKETDLGDGPVKKYRKRASVSMHVFSIIWPTGQCTAVCGFSSEMQCT